MEALALLRPWFLAALLAGAIPVIIHLLDRKRARPAHIATLRFLKLAHARKRGGLRLRNILLLLSRIALLSCLAILFAGPGCRQDAGITKSAASWIFVVDTSPSMSSARGGRSAIDAARDAVSSIVAESAPQSRFMLLATSEQSGGGSRPEFTSNAAEFTRALKNIAIEYGRHSLPSAVERAVRLAEGVPDARIVVLSDLQKSAWEHGTLANVEGGRALIIDTGLEKPENVWIDSVKETASEIAVGVKRSGGDKSLKPAVKVRLDDGRVMTTYAADGLARIPLKRPAKPYTGAISVSPGGDVPIDDETTFTGGEARKISAVFVNGDPRTPEMRDELFFARRAFSPDGLLAAEIGFSEARPADLGSMTLDGVDLLVLANVSTLPPGASGRILKSVRGGMAVLMTAGDNWNSLMRPSAPVLSVSSETSIAPLLAAPLRDVANAGVGEARSVDTAALSGPMEMFRLPDSGDLKLARIKSYWLLNASSKAGLDVSMRLDNGAPLVVERREGKGRLMLFTTTIDADGADFCLQPAFIPWLGRLIHHASGLTRFEGVRAVSGNALELPFDELVWVRQPDGSRVSVPPRAKKFTPVQPGLYTIERYGNEKLATFVTVMDSAESDTTRIGAEALDSLFGKNGYRLIRADAGGRIPGIGGRRDTSGYFAGVLIAALLLEAALIRPFGRRRKV
ncbi:MAG: VWA domain-containing protein [Nitrospirae bacterium]|nr:VWA domain-containing protein [Nitrospirota bacterium]